jgi:hypothetical protein
MWYVKFKKQKHFVTNTEKSGPDLGLAKGDSDVRIFDFGAPSLGYKAE